MTYNAHPDDQPPAEWRRFAEDEEAVAALPEFSMDDPVPVAMTFCQALDDPHGNQNALRFLVTPESLHAWGDFSEAARFLASIPDAGYGSMANSAEGDDNVAYFKILSGVTQSYQMLDSQPMSLAGVVTLVRRDDVGGWRVHAIGADYTKPEHVPHSG